MLKFFKSFFNTKKTQESAPQAPYKIEAPESKVETVNAQPIAEVKQAKAPAKPRAPKKTTAAKAPKKPRAKKEAK
jgi:hypothetical protein